MFSEGAPAGDMSPIRGELFGAQRLASHARKLARGHVVSRTAPPGFFKRRERGPLLSRLVATEQVLVASREQLTRAAADGAEVSPGGAWLLDNFFVVLEQVIEIRATLPTGYYQELPKLAGTGPLAGHPRIYDIIMELIAHTDGRLDAATVALMIREYQRVTPLLLGELWAIPAMLRLGYLENIRRMSLRVARDVADRALADDWVSQLLTAQTPEDVRQALDAFVHHGPALTPALLTRFLHQIRSRRSDFTPLLWIEQWVAEDVMSVEEAAQRSSQEVALTQLVMANSIASLRSVETIDWIAFVESASATEAVLRSDPSGTYEGMTRGTRDRYRHAVERIAKATNGDEPEVAKAAIHAAALELAARGDDAREAHVGYHLVGDGRRAFERSVGAVGGNASRLREAMRAHPSPLYFAALGAFTAALLALFISPLPLPTADGWSALWLAAALLLALIPAMDGAVAVVNQLVPLLVGPDRLPRLDYAAAVPDRDRTMVVVPLLLGSVDAVAHALDDLEVQYLANRDAQVRFALLSDFLDSDTETTESDHAILTAAIEGVRALNATHGDFGPQVPAEPPFYLMHRSRKWNHADGTWMGWERKRGKLEEFNAFIRGEGAGAFAVTEGELDWLARVRYVITLDADTVLPRGAAAALIGTIAHPLNRAEYDTARGRVVRGYGILQPRVSVSLASASESRFASVYAGHPGVDPYTTAVSDVYQDLFGEGTYTGKGIYDVDVFRLATAGRFPDNRVLSHDLIEGAFARAGLVTDIEVFDDYPTLYLTSTRRTHRWIRGDWQLMRWLTSRVPATGDANQDPLSALSRWKILDNMRRSLGAPMLLAWLVAGWTVLPGGGPAWTAAVLGALCMPWLVPVLVGALRPPRGQSWRPYYVALAHDAKRSVVQIGLALAMLPDQALLVLDAVGRTITRVAITRRRLLEWQTASQIEDNSARGRRAVWKRMWPAAIAGGLIVAVVTAGADGRASWPIQLAFVALGLAWLLQPELAILLSIPLTRRDLVLDGYERATSVRYALRHWRYFERFVTADTNWLVPDNFQETPAPVIASRTSPTNIGLQLLATVSARDLGFLTRGEMVERLERTFTSLDGMQRIAGHFYNWYDLTDLRVLEPPYVSTVDSGNLAGHLIAFAQGCLAVADGPVDDGAVWVALAAEGVQLDQRASEDSTSWVGDRLVAYQHAILDLRRKTTGASATDVVASSLWARHRLDAMAAELALLELDPEWEATRSLRAAADVSPHARALVTRLEALAVRARQLAMEMDFRLVYEPQRKLFSIGYDARSGKLDDSSYDLLASESRLASFVAIAKGDAATEHWFRLGRSLTVADGATALVSWSGSMFEYLMPLLVMPPRPFSLLDQTCHAAVHRQITYGRERGVPWGISESAYNVRDRHETYQYRAFGIPDLALKRGLSAELVVAPYATALATAVDAHDALRNLADLEGIGALGAYGFYDALDYTRTGEETGAVVVRTFMAHHIGMSLVALHNALSMRASDTEGIWQQRFMADAAVRAAALLLDERVPRRYVARAPQDEDAADAAVPSTKPHIQVHQVDTPNTAEPHVALLGGHGYNVLLTNAGSGHSRANAVDVYRWRADATKDDTGHWIYVRDVTAGTLWSVAHQPVRATPAWYRATFATDRVVFARQDGEVETRTEIAVIASEQAEVRRVTLVNHSSATRDLELTSYGEVVLCPSAADRAHQAFQKLFVQTERPHAATVLASRRPRAAGEHWPWCAHVVATGPERIGDVSCETDRAQFLGRGRTVHAPRALDAGTILSGTVGAVLDPIVALRVRMRIQPGRSATVVFTTAVAPTREAALQLADRYRDVTAAERALSLARTEAEIAQRDLEIEPAEIALYQQLAGALIYPRAALRAPEADRALVKSGQAELWAQGISGDWPIVLATIKHESGLPSVRQLLVAHRYWRAKGVRSDLVILNAKSHSYAQELQDQLVSMSIGSSEGGVLERPGGVFIRRADALTPEQEALLRTTARIFIRCDGIGLGEIVAANIREHAVRVETEAAPRHHPAKIPLPTVSHPEAAAAPPNGHGYRKPNADYAIDVAGDRLPPAPWANIVANPDVGFCVTERGGGFTWVESSYFYRLTPWFNDPVSDPCGEVIYLRDDASGVVWSPTPGPWEAATPAVAAPRYTVTHSPGASRFAHVRGAIETELTLAVPISDSVKLQHLRITNRGTTPVRLSLTTYVEWTLGADREETRHQVHTHHDAESGALFARNYHAADFAGRTAFSWISEAPTSYTGRRDHFLGRNGDVTAPAALRERQLSGEVGAGYDPCAAFRCAITLAPGEARVVVLLLGAARSEAEARTFIARHGPPERAIASIDAATRVWDERLSVITVKTPDDELDAMFNRWSLYQALACRMWARSALYQSSGAYGFRDQLQDCMAFVYAEPGVARAHLLRAAGRQFEEGDVQHWWHEPSGRGVRTRFSDDLAWLPFVTDHYVGVTGDTDVWDASAPFIAMRGLAPDEQEIYDLPQPSERSASLYEHCVRALERACTVGAHGLPLMGAGDWNDGMNRVGMHGTGESVWLAWFLCATLRRFAVHADLRGDAAHATGFRARADAYAAAVEATSWDGAWYRRAYFDDGSPLGTAADTECRIDAIAQSWAVLSGAGDPVRATEAMRSVNEHLVRDDARLLLLLTPPFDATERDPGYIKGYLPGVRENGAQYTHAALWTVLAMARLGDGDRAAELLSMINPLSRTRTPAGVDTYRVEPYVVAADIYAAEGHVGRGGWTWYTGSASWNYRAVLEGVFGFEKRGNVLRLDPCIPTTWPAATLVYRYGTASYALEVRNPDGVSRGVREVQVDGVAAVDGAIALHDDGQRHEVTITLGT